MNFDIWTILGIISISLLIIYWGKGKNAVWGTLTLGIITGFIIAILFLLKGDGFIWSIVIRGGIVGTLFGFLFEILVLASNRMRKNN